MTCVPKLYCCPLLFSQREDLTQDFCIIVSFLRSRTRIQSSVRMSRLTPCLLTMLTMIPFVASPSGNKSFLIYVLKAQHDNDKSHVGWCDMWITLYLVCSVNRKQCCIMFLCFAAQTGSYCSAACIQASSGLTRCSMETTVLSLCVHTGLSVSMTTNMDTWSIFSVATMTSLCWLQVMMETSFPSVDFLQRDREACNRRWLWSPYPGSACMHHYPFHIH